jgi:acetyl esterase/lipase
MAFELDPQILEALAPLMAGGDPSPPPPAGDWKTRRENATGLMAALNAAKPEVSGVTRTSYSTKASDGADIPMVWYAPEGEQPGSAVLYIHGGGMILGSVELYDRAIAGYVAASGVPLLAVDYRLAPEFRHPVPVNDCYSAVKWLADNATMLQVDPARIAVMGDSAGGGLAAGVVLLAKDLGEPAIARQILIYPMLDDRTTTPDPEIAPFAVWTYDDNITGWEALLGADAGTDQASPYGAPARRTDLSGLPPAYLDVGELDVFRDEDTEYAMALARAGVPVEFHIHPGAPHAFESIAPASDVGKRAIADRVRWIKLL